MIHRNVFNEAFAGCRTTIIHAYFMRFLQVGENIEKAVAFGGEDGGASGRPKKTGRAVERVGKEREKKILSSRSGRNYPRHRSRHELLWATL